MERLEQKNNNKNPYHHYITIPISLSLRYHYIMPNYKITGCESEEMSDLTIGQLIQDKETNETWLVGTFYGFHNEKHPELYAMNLQTGILEKLTFESNFKFKPLHPVYQVILSNGHISDDDY